MTVQEIIEKQETSVVSATKGTDETKEITQKITIVVVIHAQLPRK